MQGRGPADDLKGDKKAHGQNDPGSSLGWSLAGTFGDTKGAREPASEQVDATTDRRSLRRARDQRHSVLGLSFLNLAGVILSIVARTHGGARHEHAKADCRAPLDRDLSRGDVRRTRHLEKLDRFGEVLAHLGPCRTAEGHDARLATPFLRDDRDRRAVEGYAGPHPAAPSIPPPPPISPLKNHDLSNDSALPRVRMGHATHRAHACCLRAVPVLWIRRVSLAAA